LSRETDEAQKISPVEGVDKILAFTMTGHVASDDQRFQLWDKAVKISSSLSKKQFGDGERYVKALSYRLNNEINAAKRAGIIKNFSKLRKREQGSGWEIAKLFTIGYVKSFPCFVYTEFY